MAGKGYWVVSLDVSDSAAYAEYQAFVQPFLADNQGRFLIRGGRHEIVEGKSRSRQVVVEFPSYDDAVRVYHSDDYQRGMQKRLGSSVADFVIVEGAG
jgi:uncharacterized protein (DUF1330 family)